MNSDLLDIWNLNSLWKYLASIKSGDKLSIRGNLIDIQKATPLLFLKRKYYGDSRNDIFSFIQTIFKYTDYHLKNENHIIKNVQSFKQNIINGIYGLINLIETYNDDNHFISIFNSNLEKISIIKKYFNDKEDEYESLIDLESKIFHRHNNNKTLIEILNNN